MKAYKTIFCTVSALLLGSVGALHAEEASDPLSLHGDVRMRAAMAGSALPGFANSQMAADVNVNMQHKTDHSWAIASGKMTADLGAKSESPFRLESTYVGFDLYKEDTTNVSMEMGRKPLAKSFESKLQYKSLMDGFLLKATDKGSFADVSVQGSVFLAQPLMQMHPAFATEVGMNNIADTGLYTKFSYIDWNPLSKKMATAEEDAKYAYRNMQLLVGHKFQPSLINLPVHVYGAAIMNLAAPTIEGVTQNKAAYVGATVGEAKTMGTWSWDNNVQLAQIHAVPSFDFLGVPSGNADHPGNTLAYNSAFSYCLTDNTKVVLDYKLATPLHTLPGHDQNNQHSTQISFVYSW